MDFSNTDEELFKELKLIFAYKYYWLLIYNNLISKIAKKYNVFKSTF